MAYTILNSDGSTLVLLADKSIDKDSSSITLIGKNVSSYGEYFNNNLIKIMANFASTTGSPPKSPVKGQIWYDTKVKRLKVYDGVFKNISGATFADEKPTTLFTGDLWFDTINNQLNIINDTSALLVGPSFPVSIGENGFVLPSVPLKDLNLIPQNLTFLKNYGELIGIVSSVPIVLRAADATTYFGTPDYSLVTGINILGDINYTGKLKNNYLSLTVDIDKLTTSTNIVNPVHFVNQTTAIKNLLNAVYPINDTESTITNSVNVLSIETGVPVGSEARVICGHTVPFTGYQVRRFIAKDTLSWDFYQLTTSAITATNVIVTLAV
jgi:hypothetical protein